MRNYWYEFLIENFLDSLMVKEINDFRMEAH